MNANAQFSPAARAAQKAPARGAPASVSPEPAFLQRKCACGGSPGVDGECAECRKKRLAGAAGSLQRAVPPIVHDVLRSTGQPLDREARAFMEPRFGHDFSRIPIHFRAAENTSPAHPVPPIVHEVLRSPGQPLDKVTRNFMEPRFGHGFIGFGMQRKEPVPVPARLAIGESNDAFEQEADRTARRIMSHPTTPPWQGVDLSRVRVHTDARAGASARAVGALAYTVGNDIVFDSGQFAPGTSEGRNLLAHELAHVVQQSKFLRPYRKLTAFNFGKEDDAILMEDSFDIKKDKETKPWIKLVTVEFTTKKTDTDGNHYWSGTASVQYYDNPAKFADYSFTVAGGSAELGRTDRGNFTVQRIEGVGYNSGTFSGTPGVDFAISEREGPRKRYSKNLVANMSFAVFYNKGEALHFGPLDLSSHGCVHVDWSEIKQLNYHSVIGLTKVNVKYTSP